MLIKAWQSINETLILQINFLIPTIYYRNYQPLSNFPLSMIGIVFAEVASYWLCFSKGWHQIRFYKGVIPCQIIKEFWVTSRILMKLIVFVVPMVLTTHTNFWPRTSHGSDLWPQIFGQFWVTKSTIAHHCVIIVKWNFQQLKTVDRPFKWSINYGIST